jgi:hypothetical protein
LRENLALNRFPPQARDAAKVAIDALDNLLNQLPPDELTIQMMKIEENPPRRAKKKK